MSAYNTQYSRAPPVNQGYYLDYQPGPDASQVPMSSPTAAQGQGQFGYSQQYPHPQDGHAASQTQHMYPQGASPYTQERQPAAYQTQPSTYPTQPAYQTTPPPTTHQSHATPIQTHTAAYQSHSPAPQSQTVAYPLRSPQHSTTSTAVDDEELTEEERIEYEKGILTWPKCKDWRFWIRKEWIWYYVGLLVIVVVVALMVFFHSSIINWLTPFVRKLQQLRYGWLIPVAILFVLSFPPLFGNEIVMILVGVVWGLGVGFAIVAVGTILGEAANYFVFKYWCRARADREAKKNLNYACLSQSIVEGGWFMAFVVRLSVIPTHISTVIFAVCGLGFWRFLIAMIVGMPKQLITVYVGVILERNDTGQGGTNSHVISDCVFAATAIVTLGCLIYIYRKMTAVRKKVLIGMRKDLTARGVKTSEVPRGQLSGRDEA